MSIKFHESPDSFFIGAELENKKPVYIQRKDLTTHAAILGMTGSGKTGLGVTLLEEAALDGIPQIVIDPKGDMTNLILAMDDFDSKQFEPWIDPDDVPGDITRADYAKKVADQWREGLAEWGITSERIRAFKNASQIAIYTPGSDAGLQVSVLSSFNAPEEGWRGNEERLREQIERLTTAMLTLVGHSKASEVENPAHILIASLIEYNWARNNDLTLQRLIAQIQNPPFEKLGVMDIDRVISKNNRMTLAKELNNIIAAPHFQAWLQGPPLNIKELIYTSDGTPRTLILYTAHLDDDERQFIHTLIVERIMAWIHTLSGSEHLRALVYIDEVFGMLPPHPHNPPTKAPIMKLLKQARAFGVGAILATQNPTDIDYKALSNTGMWFLGKLQTNNDKNRALEAIDPDDEGTRERISDLLGQLQTREFVLHNIHDHSTPLTFKTRWAMSYLHGPLTRDQISTVMENLKRPYTDTRVKNTIGQAPSTDQQRHMGRRIQQQESTRQEPTLTLKNNVEAPGFTPVAPELPHNIEDYFLPVELTPTTALRQWHAHTHIDHTTARDDAVLMFRPTLLVQTTVRFKFRRSDSSEMLWYAFLVPEMPKMAFVDWEKHQSAPFDPDTLQPDPPHQDALYASIPSEIMRRSAISDLKSGVQNWIYNNLRLTVYHNEEMNFYSTLNESYESFYERLLPAAREAREAEIDALADKYDNKLSSLENRIRKKRSRTEAEKEELEGRQTETLVTTGEVFARLLRGDLYRTVSQVAQEHRQTKTTAERVEVLEEDLQGLLDDINQLQRELEHKVQKIKDKWVRIVKQNNEINVAPTKSDITLAFFGVGWVPFWAIPSGDDKLLTVPATPSGLAEQQIHIFGDSVPAQIPST